MSTVIEVCSEYGSYLSNCVRDCGKVKLCLLCKTGVSEQTDVNKENSRLIKLHYEKNHVPKDGMIWCNVCGSNICNVGQDGQLEAHDSGSKHEKRSAGRYYCGDCGMIDPPHDHNANHTRRDLDKCGIIRMSRRGVKHQAVGSRRGNREAEALAVMAIVNQHNVEDSNMLTEPLCSKDFAAIFKATPAEMDFELLNVGKGPCHVCKIASVFNPDVEVKTGSMFRLNWASVQMFWKGRQEKETELKPFIPLDKAGEVDKSFLAQFYVFDQDAFGFVLKEGGKEARKQAAKDFPKTAEQGEDDIY